MSSVARKIKITVEEREIFVTDPKTDWRVSYPHSTGVKGLVVTQVVTDRAAKVSERAKFMAEALRRALRRGSSDGWLEAPEPSISIFGDPATPRPARFQS